MGGVLIYILIPRLKPARMHIGIGIKNLVAKQNSLIQNGTLTIICSIGILDIRFAQ